jgi:hypothetical protein
VGLASLLQNHRQGSDTTHPLYIVFAAALMRGGLEWVKLPATIQNVRTVFEQTPM